MAPRPTASDPPRGSDPSGDPSTCGRPRPLAGRPPRPGRSGQTPPERRSNSAGARLGRRVPLLPPGRSSRRLRRPGGGGLASRHLGPAPPPAQIAARARPVGASRAAAQHSRRQLAGRRPPPARRSAVGLPARLAWPGLAAPVSLAAAAKPPATRAGLRRRASCSAALSGSFSSCPCPRFRGRPPGSAALRSLFCIDTGGSSGDPPSRPPDQSQRARRRGTLSAQPASLGIPQRGQPARTLA